MQVSLFLGRPSICDIRCKSSFQFKKRHLQKEQQENDNQLFNQ